MITCNCQSPDKMTSGGATDGQILTWSEVDQEWVPTTITLTHIAQSGATDGQVPTWRDGSGWIAETPTNIPLIPPYGDDIPQFTYTEDDEWGFKSTGASINRNAGKAELRVLDSVGGSVTLGSLKFSGDITLPDDITAGAGVTDHGALTGLADDDHPQYHTDARGDARYSLLGHTHYNERNWTNLGIDFNATYFADTGSDVWAMIANGIVHMWVHVKGTFSTRSSWTHCIGGALLSPWTPYTPYNLPKVTLASIAWRDFSMAIEIHPPNFLYLGFEKPTSNSIGEHYFYVSYPCSTMSMI
jgi:hypothetical protein